MNSSEILYSFYSYIPSRFGSGIFAMIVYISLLAWFIQSLHFKCRPFPLSIFLFMAHLTTFIELILRGTLHPSVLNRKLLYRLTAPLRNIPPRFLLLANYHCLVELRGKTPRRNLDRMIDILVPILAITGDILLAIADELSFHSHRLYLSFHFRQVSALFILILSILFYFIWYLAISHARRFYILPLLSLSSTCVLIEAIYMQILSFLPIFYILTQNELWFYVGHLIPIVLALVTWSIFHPWRLLPPPERDVPHDQAGNELLPSCPIV